MDYVHPSMVTKAEPPPVPKREIAPPWAEEIRTLLAHAAAVCCGTDLFMRKEAKTGAT